MVPVFTCGCLCLSFAPFCFCPVLVSMTLPRYLFCHMLPVSVCLFVLCCPIRSSVCHYLFAYLSPCCLSAPVPVLDLLHESVSLLFVLPWPPSARLLVSVMSILCCLPDSLRILSDVSVYHSLSFWFVHLSLSYLCHLSDLPAWSLNAYPLLSLHVSVSWMPLSVCLVCLPCPCLTMSSGLPLSLF